jgi:hypothetical protein
MRTHCVPRKTLGAITVDLHYCRGMNQSGLTLRSRTDLSITVEPGKVILTQTFPKEAQIVLDSSDEAALQLIAATKKEAERLRTAPRLRFLAK